MKHESNVAPYVGAWIETNAFSRYHKSIMSHPTWVRGLKLLITAFWEAVKKSHPTWVRGLKQAGCTSGYYQAASHPTWVRGLKQRFHRFMVEELMVAPYVGAWIETGSRLRSRENDKSHPTWVRGLKLCEMLSLWNGITSHPTWVRGLKPPLGGLFIESKSRTLRGCVD